ncbi:MAG: TatD family hydrolase [Chromatiaceae bacterium]|nr:TatD family hydrolase [Gammaproteobacteria bacterium]MCP5316848.1 TatD family hydrolase [Chromatiaceae bacterium]MCW5585098.1 TatD family hydrolase [Chromatiales bacterium]MCP5434380.1 TatD family hydrolase [Chromatiaceae bacterium]HOP17134.1 TatD family hydrolase [Gammaproteobacteria bacterium]
MLVDSHCHLDRVDLTPYHGDFAGLIEASRDAGVAHMLCVSIDLESYPAMLALVEDYPEVSVSVGVHPNDFDRREPGIDELVALARHPKNVAIGETGLDYFHGKGDLEWQRERFRTHIRAARQADKPLIIHTRDAREDTIAIMREETARDVGGVMHCFTETWEMAKAALDLGFYISFSGIVTFKNAAALRDVAAQVPDERILIETDSPYLAPVPFRGKPNEPRYVGKVAETVAAVRGVSAEAIAQQSRANFFRLFSAAAG